MLIDLDILLISNSAIGTFSSSTLVVSLPSISLRVVLAGSFRALR